MNDANSLTLRILSEGRISAVEAETLLRAMRCAPDRAMLAPTARETRLVEWAGKAQSIPPVDRTGLVYTGRLFAVRDNYVNVLNPF